MMLQYHHFAQLDSTNAYLQRKQTEADIRNWVVSADEQTAGKGMGNNGWESEVEKNLTFSMAVDMGFLPAAQQFLLSEAVPLGIIEILDDILPSEKLSIKWPNDIFYENRKLAGILINSTIKDNMMDVSIIGIGMNVNQIQFKDWPTHPISLKQITGKTYNLEPLLKQTAISVALQVERLKTDPLIIEQDYLKRLFRYQTWADYEVNGKIQQLFMTGIDPFGRLLLIDEAKKTYCFDIKEIKFTL
jgi:BirA family biotin operon repressor/biotin-[acetyl-CoA-carboxylase] ligase